MIKVTILVCLAICIISCGYNPYGKVYIEKTSQGKDIVVPAIEANISSFNQNSHESVIFELRTRIVEYPRDTTFILKISAITRYCHVVIPESPLYIIIGKIAHKYSFLFANDTCTLHHTVRNLRNSPVIPPVHRPDKHYYVTSASYEIDRTCIDNWYRTDECKFSILTSDGTLEGRIDIYHNSQFNLYYKKYLQGIAE
ncbi:MAG: hypothetical protein KAR42_12860 [candidate division Zixibacteria bacterium]|nr:hypothetical protein [candidate division Zixibacteria bacterium]